MKISKKTVTWVKALTLAFFSVGAGSASAAEFPQKPIKIVAPFTAGSAPDVYTRALASEMSKAAGVPVVVENRPGGSSGIAAQLIGSAKPDGYSVLISGNVAFTGNPHVIKNLPYDPVNGFVPLTTLSKGPMYLYANPDKVTATSAKEFLQQIKNNPGKYTFGYTSITSRLPSEVLQQTAGVKVVGAAYRSGAAMLPDLLSGEIDFMFTDFSAWTYVNSGKLKSLGVTDDVRSPFTPNLPTFRENGIEGMDITFWLAAYLPAQTPQPVVEKMYALLVQANKTPPVQAAMKASGTFEFTQPMGQLEKYQAKERELWGKIIKAAGIQPE
jgi:tripartite-type tricarboxylate transporter receptor subunit TctC